MNFNQEALAYNTWEGVESYPYNVLKILLSSENIWKLIKYDSSDALSPSNPNLTTSEKVALIWTGELNEGEIDYNKFRVFQQASTDNVFNTRTTQLRVYVDKLFPEDAIKGITDIRIEILTHSNLNGLSDTSRTRLSVMLKELMVALNGSYIEGVGNLYFNASRSRTNLAKCGTNSNKNYLGYTIVMSTNTSKINNQNC